MNKKIKGIILGTTILVATTIFIGCNKSPENKIPEDKTKTEDTTDFKKFSYVYDNGKEKVDVDVVKAPKRAITLSQFMTETLLALNLGDRMVGTALLDNPILPQYKEAYDKIPVLKVTGGHDISKEAFMALNPDFVSGWEMSINNESTGTPTELVKEGIYPFVDKALNGNATIDTVYEDITTLGKIFGVSNNAAEVITNMKNEVSKVEEKLKKIDNKDKAKVLIYDSGEKDAMVVGGGLPNNLIDLAGGKNIYGDLKKSYETVSFESIVEKNPDIIIVTDYLAGKPVQDKINFLKNNPALKDVNAIKNNNIKTIELADLSPGVRSAKAISEMNEMFYK